MELSQPGPRRVYCVQDTYPKWSNTTYGRDIHQPCAEYGGHSKSRRGGGRNDSRLSGRVSARDAKGILVKIVNLTCPGCGARLEVDMDRKMAFCSYCGAALPVDDEIQKVQLDGAEKAGYEFEKGRQRAQAEAAQASFPPQQACYQPASQPTFQPQVPPQPQQAPQEPPKRRKTWLWVLGWICIFPVPLTIIMLNKEDMSKKARYGIIAAGWILYLLIGLGGGGSK